MLRHKHRPDISPWIVATASEPASQHLGFSHPRCQNAFLGHPLLTRSCDAQEIKPTFLARAQGLTVPCPLPETPAPAFPGSHAGHLSSTPCSLGLAHSALPALPAPPPHRLRQPCHGAQVESHLLEGALDGGILPSPGSQGGWVSLAAK